MSKTMQGASLGAVAVLIGALILIPTGCGGGGGGPTPGGGVTVSDLGGGWFGPTGTSTPAGTSVGPGTGGMTADATGNVLEFQLNGTPEVGVTGTITLVDSFLGIFTFTRTDGRFGVMMLSATRNHLLYIDNLHRFGAWQKGATTLAPPYTNVDARPSAWTGAITDLTSGLVPVSGDQLNATIDPVGGLFAALFSGATAATNVDPVDLLDGTNGQWDGDWIDSDLPPNTGRALYLMTPDRQFVAAQLCVDLGSFPTDCSYAALRRN